MERHLAEEVDRHPTVFVDVGDDGVEGHGIADLDEQLLLGEHRSDRLGAGVSAADLSMKRHQAELVDRHTTDVVDVAHDGAITGQGITLLGGHPGLGEHRAKLATSFDLDFSMERYLAEVVERHFALGFDLVHGGAVGSRRIAFHDDQLLLGEHRGDRIDTGCRVPGISMECHLVP